MGVLQPLTNTSSRGPVIGRAVFLNAFTGLVAIAYGIVQREWIGLALFPSWETISGYGLTVTLLSIGVWFGKKSAWWLSAYAQGIQAAIGGLWYLIMFLPSVTSTYPVGVRASYLGLIAFPALIGVWALHRPDVQAWCHANP